MNRKGFLRSIVMIAVAPDLISQLELRPPVVSNTRGLFSDIKFMVPEYLPKLMEKYGNVSLPSFSDYIQMLEKDKIENPKLYEFSNYIV